MGIKEYFIDIDFLLLEYDKGRAVALVEYKHELAKIQYASHPTYQAIIDLGNRAGIPVFATRYKGDFTEWTVTALNGRGKVLLPERTVMTEREWVTFLYGIRGYVPPEELFSGANIKI